MKNISISTRIGRTLIHGRFLTVVSDFNLWISATIPCGPRISPAGPLARRNIKLTRSVVNGRTALRRVVSIALMKDLWDLQRVEAAQSNGGGLSPNYRITRWNNKSNDPLPSPILNRKADFYRFVRVEVVEEQRNFEFLTRNGPCKLIRFRVFDLADLIDWIVE